MNSIQRHISTTKNNYIELHKAVDSFTDAKTKKDIETIWNSIKINENSNPKDIKILIKKAEKDSIKVISARQIENVISKFKGDDQKTARKLVNGGFAAFTVRMVAKVDKSTRKVLTKFESKTSNLPKYESIDQIEKIFKNKPEGSPPDKIIYKKSDLKKLYTRYKSLKLCDKQRDVVSGEIGDFKSKQIPLNSEFDKTVQKTQTSFFGTINQNKGISSTNRQTPHLINGYLSTLEYSGTTFYRALRHAVLADLDSSKKTVRQANAKTSAQELVTAALLQELDRQQLSLDQAASSETPIALNLNSVSLVTPDRFRHVADKFKGILKWFGIKTQANERRALQEQTAALASLAKAESITVDGKEIPINLSVNSFNFGVNQGAVGIKLPMLPKFHTALSSQFKSNKAAWENTLVFAKEYYNQCNKDIINFEKTRLELLSQGGDTNAKRLKIVKKIEERKAWLDNFNILNKDINAMLADEKAYLSGSNQYEVGAKILLFTNLLNNLPGATAGFHASINCKSGKDRTGIMDAVAKTHEIMRAQNNGKYYSTDSITGDVEEQFKETFINVLENGGGLDITEVNTGVRGYKVGKEAKLFGMTDADWKEITGLATFASS